MAQTPYPYLHGAGLGGLYSWDERPYLNVEKNSRFDGVGVTYSGTGHPQRNPTNYGSGGRLKLVVRDILGQNPHTHTMPAGTYYLKTDPHVVVTPDSGVTITSMGGGVWKLAVTDQLLNVIINVDLGSANGGLGTPLTFLRIRREITSGVVPASIDSDDVIWRPEFIDYLKTFGNFRFMDWLVTNEPGDHYYNDDNAIVAQNISDVPLWVNRSKTTDMFWNHHVKRGVPVDVCVNLCNTVGNRDGWFNIPYMAHNDYITGLVTYVRDNLNGVAHFELSNEIWNNQFMSNKAAKANGAQKAADGNPLYTSRPNDEWMYQDIIDRAGNLFTIVNNLYAGQLHRKRNVIAYQTGVRYYGDQLVAGLHTIADIYSGTHYFSGPLNANGQTGHDEYYNSLGDGVYGSASWQLALRNSLLTDTANQFSAVSINARLKSAYDFAHTKGLEYATYEGGSHTHQLNTNNAPLTQALIPFHQSEYMREVHEAIINNARANMPGAMLNWFTATAVYSQFGFWGLKQFISDPPLPRTQAVINDAAANDSYTWGGVTPPPPPPPPPSPPSGSTKRSKRLLRLFS